MSQKMDTIIVKFLMNTADVDEIEMLTEWLKKAENKQYFKDYIKTNYAINYNLKNYNSKNFKKDFLRKIKLNKSIYVRYKFHKILEYAAVAVLVFGLAYIFEGSLFSNSDTTTPSIVNTNTILPGTDKATLTLEDGSVVELEKGSTLKTTNANSNGEQIVYKGGEHNSLETVYNYLTVPRGGEFFVILADGTEVWLNSESQLKYPVNFNKGSTRLVELIYGEAYFSVSPSTANNGTKFKVLNHSQEIEVLGTEFNIKAYADETNVYTSVVEGKVTVNNGDSIQELNPNQQSILNIETNRMTVGTVDIKSEISWKNGIFSFMDLPLKDIMKVISRWYDVEVIFENKALESVEFVGVLSKRQSITQILSIIKSTSINNYEIKNKTIILK
ncbi:FecR family protein [Arenibacter sp. ARW7G5Y1]|nr:FecR family protein [Arenibacter sp. ARW7G5Y1]